MKSSGYKTFKKRDRDKLEALYNAGLPIKRIAEELGFTYSGVYYELKRGYYMHRNHDWSETKKYSADKAQLIADINAYSVRHRYTVSHSLFARDAISDADFIAPKRRNILLPREYLCDARIRRALGYR